jgi:hypothetical protein
MVGDAPHRRSWPQRAAMYIVISKPKRKSWAVGVCHVIAVSLMKKHMVAALGASG